MAGSLGIFLDKMRNWKFNPPSSNLWVIHLSLYNDGSQTKDAKATHDLLSLYENIKKVNNQFDSVYNSAYGVIVDGENGENNLKQYISLLDDGTIGLFLATDLTMNTNKVTIKDQESGTNTAFTGWLKFGKVQTGRDHNLNIKVKFLKSNWDINELLFDPWIAAIGQQGLIEGDEEDGLYNIKGNMMIMEYAASAPGKDTNTWVLRKVIELNRCFPVSRDQYTYTYSPDKAGSFESAMVTFEFDYYKIRYTDFPHYETKLVDIVKNLPPLKGQKASQATPKKATPAKVETPIAVNTNEQQGGAGMTNMYNNMSNMA